MKILTVNNLTQTYKNKVAVNHINLSINKGDLVSFLGPNGAGKSTTMRMLTGLTKPASGKISLLGLHPGNRKYRHEIGITFQSSVLDGELTVKQNLKSRLGMYRNIDLNFVQHLIHKFNIKSIMNQKYKTLSGGQKRRVDITRSLINKPQVLFLDEPSTGLDIQTRRVIWNVLKDLRREYQLTIILTTHYLEETDHADYVYIMNKGSIIANDTVDNLKHKYAGYVLNVIVDNVKATKSLIGNENRVSVHGNKMKIVVTSMQAGLQIIDNIKTHIKDLEYHHGNMNDIFLALTGKDIK
ncbi:ABC transporter ATP-binding protein [Philodulcilactobacillus myokoensis]|uniref:ABC transporter ATP-binding protein n=1 Tax=Philodulcilactobacillus myokoensis TaxID=2929573 RepID=A0A9W6EUW1_9LACO|nr:ABC transporter ATP-binding protein [Philodulcilactobacillus myokoensis]GLB47604.1 ABC transporter ATP-binding protein [Philodulcilactobacillus myokoensis]